MLGQYEIFISWACTTICRPSCILKEHQKDCFFLHLLIFFGHLHTQHENTFFSFLYHPHRVVFGLCNSETHLKKRLLDYIIRKLNKTSGFCNPESNHVSEKRLSDYIIQKVITNLKNDFWIT